MRRARGVRESVWEQVKSAEEDAARAAATARKRGEEKSSLERELEIASRSDAPGRRASAVICEEEAELRSLATRRWCRAQTRLWMSDARR